ncbi:putative RNase H-like HicB family nuclease [Peribacillus deserti]|uniref:RNase H-like HicB family nuclease n=1 Tax=Peribacillus deserti TaxID=673318 RepID=A0ABS2QHI7_9BACI|nr:hypothetical protein [Peribacillus deserti]MBM7692593.1 putative RNase H-like HicB family nuclease [Peribacillus deserti]
MQGQYVDFALISKAIQTTFEKLKEEGHSNDRSLTELLEAERNLNQALSFHLQAKI